MDFTKFSDTDLKKVLEEKQDLLFKMQIIQEDINLLLDEIERIEIEMQKRGIDG